MTALLRRTSRLAGAVMAVILLALTTWPAPASAHAGLVGSSPAEGEALATAPSSVSFEFSEPMVSPAYVVVTAPDGSAAAVGTPAVDGTVVTQEVRPGGPDGTWTTAVRAVSEDGHPVTAQITFSVGAGSSDAPAGTTEASAPAAASPEDTAPSGSEAASSTSGAGWTRGRTDLVVAAGIFGLAGLLLLLARRSPR